jgi:hypothetical protein
MNRLGTMFVIGLWMWRMYRGRFPWRAARG